MYKIVFTQIETCEVSCTGITNEDDFDTIVGLVELKLSEQAYNVNGETETFHISYLGKSHFVVCLYEDEPFFMLEENK